MTKRELRLLGSAPATVLTIACMGACLGEDPSKSSLEDATDASSTNEAAVGEDVATSNDASSDAPSSDADADASVPLEPPAIFGTKLVLWLDADQASTLTMADAGDRVMKWDDRSTFANNATAYYSGAGAITVEANAVASKHRALKFSGDPANTGHFVVPDTTSLQFGNAIDFMIVVVAAYANAPSLSEYGGRAQLIAKTPPGYPGQGLWLTGNAYSKPLSDGGADGPDSVIFAGLKSFAAGSNAGAWSAKNGFNDSQFRVYAMRKDTASKAVFVRANGEESSSTVDIDTTKDVSAIGANLQIAGTNTGTNNVFSPLKGYLAEVLIMKGTNGSVLERAQLDAYLKYKYGLSL